MSELEIIELIQTSYSQVVVLFSQIIAVNFAMIVAIYYFLSQAGRAIKGAAFLLYTLGAMMFLLFAVRESGVVVAASDMLKALDADSLFRCRPLPGGVQRSPDVRHTHIHGQRIFLGTVAGGGLPAVFLEEGPAASRGTRSGIASGGPASGPGAGAGAPGQALLNCSCAKSQLTRSHQASRYLARALRWSM